MISNPRTNVALISTLAALGVELVDECGCGGACGGCADEDGSEREGGCRCGPKAIAPDGRSCARCAPTLEFVDEAGVAPWPHGTRPAPPFGDVASPRTERDCPFDPDDRYEPLDAVDDGLQLARAFLERRRGGAASDAETARLSISEETVDDDDPGDDSDSGAHGGGPFGPDPDSEGPCPWIDECPDTFLDPAPIASTADLTPSYDGIELGDGWDNHCDEELIGVVWAFLQANADLVEWSLCVANAANPTEGGGNRDCVMEKLRGERNQEVLLLLVPFPPCENAMWTRYRNRTSRRRARTERPPSGPPPRVAPSRSRTRPRAGSTRVRGRPPPLRPRRTGTSSPASGLRGRPPRRAARPRPRLPLRRARAAAS